MARGARGKNAIHHVNPSLGVECNLFRSADPHQIARPVGGKMLERRQNNVAGQFARFADAEAADGVSGETDVEGARGGFAAKLRIHAALDNAEQSLRLPAPMLRRIVILSGAKDLLFLTADG